MNTNTKFFIAALLAVAVCVGLQLAIPATASAYCNSDLDCGTSSLNNNKMCQGNTIYQDYVSYTCINPGTSYSSCNVSVTPKTVTICPTTCNTNAGYPACTIVYPTPIVRPTVYPTVYPTPTPGNTCYSHSFQKCVGSSVYWFNSCNTQQELVTTCSASQMCQGNACFDKQTSGTTYNPHFTKICSDNNVYWYDSVGTRQEIFQTCATPNSCQNAQCSGGVISSPNVTPNNSPIFSPNPTPNNGSTAAVSESFLTKFVNFLKNWYIWIIVLIILTILFVVIFRRLSAEA